jgi:hypothetical protein
MSYEMLRNAPGFQNLISRVRAKQYGTSPEHEQNVLDSYNLENPTQPDVASGYAAGSKEEQMQALKGEGLDLAMGTLGAGPKSPKGPPARPVESAFRLPETFNDVPNSGRVIHTGAFHDIGQLPGPFKSQPELMEPHAGFANQDTFWTRPEVDSMLHGQNPPGAPIYRGGRLPGTTDPYGYDLNRPPTVYEQHPSISGESFGGPANMPMPGAPKTKEIGHINELGGFYEPPIEDVMQGKLGKFFQRPTSSIGELPMPHSGLPDEIPDEVLDRLLNTPTPPNPSFGIGKGALRPPAWPEPVNEPMNPPPEPPKPKKGA